VIVMEMINGHALVISLMAAALISSRVSRLLAPPLYEALSERYISPAASTTAAPEVPGVGLDEAVVTDAAAETPES
jgi:H+/Cl- antiporter ClcA